MIEEAADQAATEGEAPIVDEGLNLEESSEASEEEGQQAETSEYVPNYTYKVYDEEQEMPDWAQSWVIDKGAEDNLRSLFAKSGAFDPLKEKYEKNKIVGEEKTQQLETVMKGLDELQYYIDNKALTQFFQRTKISEEDVISWVKQRIGLGDLSPEQRTQYDQNQQSLVQNYTAQRTALDLQTENEKLTKAQHEFEYQKAFTLPEVMRFSGEFDAKMGVGAFRKEADVIGESFYLNSGKTKNLSPLEAVKQVMDKYQPLFGQTITPVEPTLEAVRAARESKKPSGTLPNLGQGESVSPSKKRFTDLNELRKYVKEQTDRQSVAMGV